MERDFVRWICERLPQGGSVVVGAGDDAAVLRLDAGSQLVVTTDMLMDGVDFQLARHEPERIGRKALAVNLSDLAAMAAKPVGAVVSVALPRQGGETLGRQLIEGMLALATELQCPIVGGDTNSWDGQLVISVTALGQVMPGKAWLRSGARAGDEILVTGEFGGSILGGHFDFQPRVNEARWLAEHANVRAAIDVSDGLSLDLFRICEASGCGAEVDLAVIPVSDAARQLTAKEQAGQSAIDHALADGEDFELILAVPPAEAEWLLAQQPLGERLTRIGKFIEGAGLVAMEANGQLRPLTPRGYEHRLES